MASGNRYIGKPLLRILECYVLWAIGELGEQEERILQEMEPNLRKTFNQPGEWRDIVASVMELPKDMPELIRSCWAKNQEIAKQHNTTLTGQQFAETFVDNNLAN